MRKQNGRFDRTNLVTLTEAQRAWVHEHASEIVDALLLANVALQEASAHATDTDTLWQDVGPNVDPADPEAGDGFFAAVVVRALMERFPLKRGDWLEVADAIRLEGKPGL